MKTGLIVLALVATAASAPAQESQDFQWRGRVATGRTLEIRGVNGEVEVTRADGDMVSVDARRRSRRDDPLSVRIEVVEHAGGVTICAVYPTPRNARQENDCQPGGGHSSVRDNDVSVDFLVRIPAGVHFDGNTVNGDVDIDGVQGDVRATTVNGGIDIRTTGLAVAETVNGDITAQLGRSDFTDDAEFETVNGSITIEMPEGLNVDFHAETVNGSIDSDFPIMVSGRMNRRSIRGTIGNGGPDLEIKTVNGSIRLRRI